MFNPLLAVEIVTRDERSRISSVPQEFMRKKVTLILKNKFEETLEI
jgi:hypothetical protein